MNIILAEKQEVVGDKLIVGDHRAKHIVKVLRAEVGDRVRVGLINGAMGSGTLTTINKKYPFSVTMDLDLRESPRCEPYLDLILALPRPIMLKRILCQVTTLGVGTIHLVNASRVEKSYWESGILLEREYRSHLLQGLEQAAIDTHLPTIRIHTKFNPFIEDAFPAISQQYRYLLFAHPTGGQELGNVIDCGSGRIILAVGPEGGWVDYEVKKFKEQGFCSCTIGERILKVDTAVVALHSRISALREVHPVTNVSIS